MQDKFFYHIYSNRYVIADLSLCAKSERTFDIALFDLANNENLLNALYLIYMSGRLGVTYTYQSRAEFFCRYLCEFNESSKEAKLEKALLNPTVRLLIQNDELLTKVKQILNHV